MHDRALVPRRRVRVAQMALQHQDLPQELDVAPRERKDAEARAQLFRAAMMLLEQPERDEQRAEQDGIARALRDCA